MEDAFQYRFDGGFASGRKYLGNCGDESVGQSVDRDARNTTPVAETEGWPNWVIADKTHSEAGHYSYSPWKGWSAEEELQPAGLIGPVQLRCLEVQ